MHNRYSKKASILGLATLTACSSPKPLALQIATATITSSVSRSQRPIFLSSENHAENLAFIEKIKHNLQSSVKIVSIYRRKYDDRFEINYNKFLESFTLNIKSNRIHVYCNIPNNVDLSENIGSFCFEQDSRYLITDPSRSFLDLYKSPSRSEKVETPKRTIIKPTSIKREPSNEKTAIAQVSVPEVHRVTWVLYHGFSLRNQMLDWGKRAGWKVIWPVELDWIVPITTSFVGEFDGESGVLAQIIKALNAQGKETHVTLYKNNKTAIVTTEHQR